MTSAIDCLVNVDMGDQQAARVDDPGQGGLLQGRRLLPSRARSCPSCSTTWTPTGWNGPSCSPGSGQRRTGPSASRRSAPTASPSGVGGFNLLRPMKTRPRPRVVRARPPGRLRRRRAELLGRRHVPAERRRLLPALHEVLRARPAAVHEHRHPRPADPRRGAEPDPPRPGLRALPRAQAVHDPRRRPLVGHGHPADAQVQEPAADDLGVVAQAPARVAAALHGDPGQGPHPVRLRLPGALHGTRAWARPPSLDSAPTRSATPGSYGNARDFFFASGPDFPRRTRWNVSVHYGSGTTEMAGAIVDFQPIDADNHYYETARRLHPAPRPEVPRPRRASRCRTASASSCSWAARSTASSRTRPSTRSSCPGCLDPLFRGQIPEGVEPAHASCRSSRCGPSTATATSGSPVMDEQGLGAALLFPTLGCGVEEALRDDIEATMATLSAFNRWLEEDWGFDYEHRIIAAPMLSLADPEAAVRRGRLADRAGRPHGARPARRRCPGPNGTGRSLGHKSHDPVWARLAEASIPVAFHLGDSGYNARSPRRGAASATFEGFGNVDVLEPHPGVGPGHPRHHRRRSSSTACSPATRRCGSPASRTGRTGCALLVKRLRKQANQTPWVFPEDPLDTLRQHVWVTPYCEEDLARAGRPHRRGAHPVRLGLAPRRGPGPAARLRQGARRLRRARGPQDHARQLPRAARGRAVSDGSREPADADRRSGTRSDSGSTSTGTRTSSVDDVVEAAWPRRAGPRRTSPPDEGGRGLLAARSAPSSGRPSPPPAPCAPRAGSAC